MRFASETTIRNTFRSLAEAWYSKKENDGRAESTLDKIRTYLDRDILPALGDYPVAEITRLRMHMHIAQFKHEPDNATHYQ